MKQHVMQRVVSWNQCQIETANHARSSDGESEDYILADAEQGLFGVFDSVGGRDQGLLVSHRAGTIIASSWQELTEAGRLLTCEDLEVALQQVISRADQEIVSLALPAEQKRPATTVALGVLSSQQDKVTLTIAHVGDSRIYLQRQGEPLQQLTEDHSYFSFMVRRGLLTQEESRRIEQATGARELSAGDLEHFLRRNKITRAVGWGDFPPVQARSITLTMGDRVLFCTDGVHDNLTDQEIAEILNESGTMRANQLVSSAFARSEQKNVLRAKPDDMSALVIHVSDQRTEPDQE